MKDNLIHKEGERLMEVLIGILLLFQWFLMIKLLQMNRQTLQQIKVQNEKLIKIEEQRVAMQREEKKESEKEKSQIR